MIEWLKQLPQGSLIDKRHWEHKSYGDSHVAEEFTVFLDLNPPDVHTDHHSGYLDREQAYFAFQEFRELIALYGAMKDAMYGWKNLSELTSIPGDFDPRISGRGDLP
ncbi:MAG: hypothetical protein L6R38_006521 [Xanthoria sp. 2 TBL-2021]|nr:MAG: hypothetical protein L6R38_006521 [Xanthoria sp. 2 TBL-2021]